MRDVQRTRLIRRAIAKHEPGAIAAVHALLDKRLKRIKRDLRVGNLRHRLRKAAGVALDLWKDDGDSWQAWIDSFANGVKDALRGVVEDVYDTEGKYWLNRGSRLDPLDYDAVFAAYQDRVGRQISNIAEGTRDDTLRTITEWYNSDRSLPELIDELGQYYDIDRAETIARTESAALVSQVAYEAAQQNGITKFDVNLAPDDGPWPCQICIDQADANPHDIDDDMPPFHPRDRCDISYVVDDNAVAKYRPDQPRDARGRWTADAFADYAGGSTEHMSIAHSQAFKAKLSAAEQKAMNYYTYKGDRRANGYLRGGQVWANSEDYNPPTQYNAAAPTAPIAPQWHDIAGKPYPPFKNVSDKEPEQGKGIFVNPKETDESFKARHDRWVQQKAAYDEEHKKYETKLKSWNTRNNKAKLKWETDNASEYATYQQKLEQYAKDYDTWQAKKEAWNESDAVKEYTAEYNKKHANEIAANKQKILEHIDTLDSAFGHTDGLPEHTVLYRGLKSIPPGLTAGKNFTEKGYTSTTISDNVAKGFMTHDGVLMHIYARKGTPGGYVQSMSEFPHEQEFLVARGTRYHVDKIETDTYGRQHVYAHVVTGSGKVKK